MFSPNIETGDLPVEVKSLTDGKSADLVLDAVGGQMFEPSPRSLRSGGGQVAICKFERFCKGVDLKIQSGWRTSALIRIPGSSRISRAIRKVP
jgi:NADPH:quinone reductase-like Zn-dependent oxidoreductase